MRPEDDAMRAEESADWSARAAAWDRWADRLAPLAERLNQPLLDAAEIGPGQIVVDLASGAGEPALAIAGRVGNDGFVLATDLVPEMLAGARRRAAAQGRGNLGFLVADMTELPLGDAEADRLTCRFGLMFVPEPVRAMAEALRVLRPGGITAWMAWGPLESNTTFQLIDRTADQLFGSSLRDRPLNPFRFSESGSLAALLAEAGHTGVFETELRFSPRIEADQPFWLPTVDMLLGHELARIPETERQRFAEALAAGFEACRSGGYYQVESHVRLALGGRSA